MKITKIEKKKQLYLSEIDTGDKLYVAEDTIAHFMLSKNMEIDGTALKDIQKFTQLSCGKNPTLYHISFRQRAAIEVRKCLGQHDIDDLYVPEILGNLKKENWINDEQCAETYLPRNPNTGGKGACVLKQKLIQKGINSQLVDQELANLDFSPLSERVAQKLLRKYRHRLSTKTLKDKIIQNMMDKGFSCSGIKIVFESLGVEKDNKQEFELFYKRLDKQYRKYNEKYDGCELEQQLTQSLARRGFSFNGIVSALRGYLQK